MEKQFKEIKQFTTAMGFKNQRQFREHVESKRFERSKYKSKQSEIDSFYSLNPKERSVRRDSKYSESLKAFAGAMELYIPSSNHAFLTHSAKIEYRKIRYCGKKIYAPLDYTDISYYRYGNKIVIQTMFKKKLQRKVVELPVNWKRFSYRINGVMPNEIGYESVGGIVIRYSFNEEIFQKTGVAIKLDNPFKTGSTYWEHGKTIRDCINERENKVRAVAERDRINAENEKYRRKQRLISRLCNKIRITFQDALDSGNCIQGVTNFVKCHFPERMPVIENNGFVNNKSISLGELKNLDSSNYTERVINYVTMMVSHLTV